MTEVWREFWFGSSVYEVSDCGRVRRKGGQPRKPYVIRRYESVDLWDHQRSKHFFIHTLVAHCFIGPRPPGLEVNHKNSEKFDNRAENLEYVTRKQNAEHARAAGRYRVGDRHTNSKLTPSIAAEIRGLAQTGMYQRDIAARFGVSQRTVWNVIHSVECRADCRVLQ